MAETIKTYKEFAMHLNSRKDVIEAYKPVRLPEFDCMVVVAKYARYDEKESAYAGTIGWKPIQFTPYGNALVVVYTKSGNQYETATIPRRW